MEGRRAAGALLALGVCACSPTLDWRDTTFPDAAGLAAQFPCKPERFTRSLPLAGRTVALSLSSCKAGGATYALAHADVVDPAAVTPALSELRAAHLPDCGPGPRVLGDVRVPGATPNPQAQRVEITGRSTDGAAVRGQTLFFVRGTRVHQATVLGTAADSDGADIFFGSFRVGG